MCAFGGTATGPATAVLSSWHIDVVLGTRGDTHIHTHVTSRILGRSSILKQPNPRRLQGRGAVGVVWSGRRDRHETVQGARLRLPNDYSADTLHDARTHQPGITLENRFITCPLGFQE